MSWKMTNKVKQYVKTMKARGLDVTSQLKEVQENATLLAIEKATELTPPTEDSNNGTGTITGNLKSAWARDSVKVCKKKGDRYITELNNKVEYASFVNDGHRMSKHFVPGLIINPHSGLLEKAPDGMGGGIMVGTKTSYVPGIFMKEAALKTYQESVESQIDELLKGL